MSLPSDYNRNRSWIQTFTGKQFWPLEPDAESVDIRDIAHSLALKCRFSGHTTCFASVAQHSVMASLNIVPEFALWALLHDASEAYVPDIASPIKPWISGFKEIEDNILKAVAAKFGLVWPMPDAVHEIDSILLLTERRDVMLPTKLPWAQISFKAKGLKPLEAKIKPWSWRRAEKKFLSRFEELAGEAKQEAPVDYAKVKALRGGVKPVEEADDDDTFVCLSPTKASQVSLHDPAECLPRAGSCKTYEPNRLRLYGDKAGRWDNVVRALEEDR